MLQSDFSQSISIMDLKEHLRDDMVAAMRAGDVLRRDVLRMILAAVKQTEVDSLKALDEGGVQDVLRKQIKQRQESVTDFRKAGRGEDVDRELAEIAIIESYLPQMMSREEIEQLAKSAIAESGVSDVKGMGQVMNVIMPQVRGRADGRLVNEVVRSLLQ
jgi:uncharacterized protein YqeY